MEFHERLRELRRQAGLSLRQLAQSTNYSRSYLSELETGIKRPPPETAERLDEALSAGGGLLALARRRSDGDAPLLDDPEHIDQRRRRVNSSNVDDAILGYLDESVAGLILEYERRPPTMMAPRARHLRGYVDQMLAGRQHPWQRERLYGAAVHLCGLLGALALDLGLPRHARAYGLEAFDLADAAGLPDLLAWARATQSLIAYYAGDYHDALAYARDGQRRGTGSPHRVRLAVNGEARALARLGDPYGVDEAVDRAFTTLGEYRDGGDVSVSMTLGAYCFTRVNANAATAYLSLGRAVEVERYGVPALAAFDQAELRGPQALTRLDLATAALGSPDPDPDRASQLAVEALKVSAPQRFQSVTKRAREFVDAAQPWSTRQGVRAVAELVADRIEHPPTTAVGLPES